MSSITSNVPATKESADQKPSIWGIIRSAGTDVNFLRRLTILNGFVPLAFLIWDAARGNLGANAVNNAIRITGILTLVFLILSLCITPIRRLTGWNQIVVTRRSLGLFGFMYAMIHFSIYFVFDRALNVDSTIEEITTRTFLLIGFIAVVLMIPLAITSTNGMIRRLGAKAWKWLHRLTYVVVTLGVLHFYLLVKSDVRQPIAFAAVLAPLLLFRVADGYYGLRKRAKLAAASLAKQGTTTIQRPKFWKGTLRVAKIFTETPNVRTFRFQMIDGEDIPFRHQAGQYLNIKLPVDGKIVRRSYTIASSPEQSNYIEISVKREDQGVGSRYLHDHVKEGDQIEIGAPAGRFVFADDEHQAVTLIAGGVGVTPMMSIARSLTNRSWAGQIYFVFAARTEEDLIFRQELDYLQDRFPNFNVLFTLTGLPEGHTWSGATERLNSNLLGEFVPDVTQHPALICGPKGMMDATCDLLKSMGLQDSWILTEEFVSPGVGDGASQDSGDDAEEQ